MALTKISTDGVKDDAVTAGKIPANAVGSSELADNAVDTNAIADQAVALSKLPHGDGSNNGKFLRANNGADPSFESIPAGTTINNNADNRIITGSGTANTLEAESSITYDGTKILNISSSAGGFFQGTDTDGGVGLVEMGNGNVALQADTGNAIAGSKIQFYVDNTQRAVIDADGLKFNSDTAAANALDDYEEGTWTVNTDVGSPNTTHSASYTKIGRMVTVSAYITCPTSSNGNNFRITSLPFTTLGSANYAIGAAYTQVHTTDNVIAQINPGNNDLYVYKRVGNSVTFADMSGAYLLFTATYFTG